MLTQFIRYYLHPTTGEIAHIYCNDEGRAPDFEPLNNPEVQYTIVDHVLPVTQYIPPPDIKAVAKASANTVTFRTKPTHAITDAIEVAPARPQPAPPARRTPGEGLL